MHPHRYSLLQRSTASVLVLLLLDIPAVARATTFEDTEPAETYRFADSGPSLPSQAAGTTSKNAIKTPTVPTDSAGAYPYSYPIEVPPGRLGMTPNLSLRYSSQAYRTDSPVGAGWTFGPPEIHLSTRKGFPPTDASGTYPKYDYARVTFEGPSGEMVLAPATERPIAATGEVYIPIRETSPVRYEKVSEPDGTVRWIEYLPSGIKRYYGSDSAGNKADIANELGQYAWLLLEETDAHGNNIQYAYHNLPEAGRAARLTRDTNNPFWAPKPQIAPVLKSVRWGGNSPLNLSHAFSLTTTVSPNAGPVDMLHGGVILSDRIDSIAITGPATGSNSVTNYWRYDLTLSKSRDTARYLLRRIERSAPGEMSTGIDFAYSNNDSTKVHFSGRQAMPPALSRVYSHFLANMQFQNDDELISPAGLRSGSKFMDFDGDGDTDIVYHPAGFSSLTSKILSDSFDGFTDNQVDVSFTQTPGANRWAKLEPGPVFASSTLQRAGIPDSVTYSDLADVDGDGDADAIKFPVNIIGREEDALIRLGILQDPISLEAICGSATFWQDCGAVDPVPEELISQCIGPDCEAADPRAEWLIKRDLFRKIIDPAGILPPPTCAECGPMLDRVTPVGHPENVFRPDVIGSYRDIVPTMAIPDFHPELAAGHSEYRSSICLGAVKACGEVQIMPEFWRDRNRWPDLDPFGSDLKMSVFENFSKHSVRPMKTFQVLHDWPTFAFKQMRIADVMGPNGNHYNKSIVEADFSTSIGDINADGRADITLLKAVHLPGPGAINRFLPRVYISNPKVQANSIDEFEHQSRSGSGFGASISHMMTGSVCLATDPATGDCTDEKELYPEEAQFNANLLDINGDGLPDLVLARAPRVDFTKFGKRECLNGSNVYLSRGYTWETTPDKDIPGLSYSPVASDPSVPIAFDSPFWIAQNRDKPCSGSSNEPSAWSLPMAAAAVTDLNADGRPDIIFAAQLRSGTDDLTLDGFYHEVFLNTGRGFKNAGPSLFANLDGDVLPNGAGNELFVGVVKNDVSPRILKLGDQARFVDLNSDGLVDILLPGQCDRFSLNCLEPMVHWNLSKVPDLLERVESDTGAWSKIEYAAAAAAQNTTPALFDGQPGQIPPGLMVVSKVTSGSQPLDANLSPSTEDSVLTISMSVVFEFCKGLGQPRRRRV